ncbi:transposase [Sutcliffiella deserti]|uniref:transposase n=1 Tax=Sutcliffiella deserti TaxID=2875501 RepID=UPI001CBD4628|nr:transposase [Sutcliffiella deserti]
MPRQARKRSKSGIYHIIMRGINKQTIFEEEHDKQRFLVTVAKYKKISNFELYSYCLMDNHIHLLMKESEEESISDALKRINSSYVYWYNAKYERCGHLFQERFKSENVETEDYFFTVLRYIHQNPIKAGLSNTVFEYKWTSFHEYFNQSCIVDTEEVLQLFSPNRKTAMEIYITYMQQSNEDQCLEDYGKIRRSDSEIIALLTDYLGIPNISTLQKTEKDKRDAALAELKQVNGVTIRQLARITGLSRSVIQRI